MTIAMLLATGWLVAIVWPDLPAGRMLRRHLIERPAAWAVRVRRGQVAMAALVAIVLIAAAWLGQDALSIVAMGSPDIVVASIDLATVLDMAMTAVLAWTLARAPRPGPGRPTWRPMGRRSRRVRRPAVRTGTRDDKVRRRAARHDFPVRKLMA